jgi:formylglycine-generating enzyme required for sulfatase activity
MLLTFDQTHFPLLAVEEADVEIHLLPITKQQFEQFVTASGPLEQARYEKLLALNPAISPDSFSAEERERLFVTGILPGEALAFAQWLGEGFDLPTVKEWRAVYAALKRTSLPRHDLAADLADSPAGAILARLTRQMLSHLMLDISLMRGGLVEWVRQRRSWVGLGAPRPEFQPNLWDPLDHEIKPLQLDQRLPYFGFRLIRRGEWYLADKENVRYIE